MAKVFTITEGLENLGALKTGGQGSVYKGKRTGEIFTAIKLLPTPIHNEDINDKNYRDFTNEVEKLKKVNEEPNSNVVTILGSGITESGSLPYIEMEFIEGPDLAELVKPPHDPIFTIQETIKVALHLSNALAHCHKCDVKHGDIKSNNVKFNTRTGNYILLDFGLAVMSDEDRRTSLRHAGAIEFMAPEQNGGKILFQTDVYCFGIIIFELLAGQVPFPLADPGQTSRHAVMVSHMEDTPPDVVDLRKQHMPEDWTDEKKAQEMQVPQWLVEMIEKCLEKNPEDRFSDGTALHDFIQHHHRITSEPQWVDGNSDQLKKQIKKLKSEKEQLQKQLFAYQREAKKANLNLAVPGVQHSSKTVSGKWFYAVLIFAILAGSVAVYSMFFSNPSPAILSSETSDSLTDFDSTLFSKITPKKKVQKKDTSAVKPVDSTTLKPPSEEVKKEENTVDTSSTQKKQDNVPVSNEQQQ